MPSRLARYSGSERPACRMNHTGTRSSGCILRHAATSRGTSGARAGTRESFHGQESPARRISPLGAAEYARRMAANSDAAGGGPPDAFRRAVEDLMSAPWRSELHVEELPAPQRIAPYSAAITADVVADGEEHGQRSFRAAPRSGRQRRLARHVPLRHLCPRRCRSRDGDRPTASPASAGPG